MIGKGNVTASIARPIWVVHALIILGVRLRYNELQSLNYDQVLFCHPLVKPSSRYHRK